MSQLEWQYFYMLEWSPVVVDIREQYPLELDETLAIAELHAIPHPSPTNRGAQDPCPITTDVVITIRRSMSFEDQARTVKYANDLSDNRVLEKFEIERLYWKSRNIDWGIVTEREIEDQIVKNMIWLHPYLDISSLLPLTENTVRRVEAVLTSWIVEKDEPLCDLTDDCDDRLCLLPGTSLIVVRHLLANRRWQVDMHKLIEPSERVILIAPPEVALRRRAGGDR
jgi:hypothetical protein